MAVLKIKTFKTDVSGFIGNIIRGGYLKKWCRAEGGTKIFGVFRVEIHDFTPKNHIFSNFRGGRAPGVPPPHGSAPDHNMFDVTQPHNFQYLTPSLDTKNIP